LTKRVDIFVGVARQQLTLSAGFVRQAARERAITLEILPLRCDSKNLN
jgi:hypothetical protein